MAVHPARGMRDILPAEARLRLHTLNRIREVFSSHGFAEIETPSLETIERLTSGQGGDNEKMLFKVMKRGVPEDEPRTPAELAELGLRYDLTLPLARYIATHSAQLPPVFKSIQIGHVWRAERPQRGRYRQLIQCDIDISGDASSQAEIELLDVVSRAVLHTGLDHLTLHVNDRRILVLLLDQCGVPSEQHAAALIAVDKLDKIGVDGVLAELRDKVGVADGPVAALSEVLEQVNALPDTSDVSAVGALLTHPDAAPLVEEIGAIAHAVTSMHADGRVRVEFDLTLVRGMGYYTGPIFELAHPGFSGAIGGGGRYDGMIGRFSGRDIPACGVSIGFERLALILEELAREPERRVVLLHSGPDELAQGLREREELLAGHAEAGKFTDVHLATRPKRPKVLLETMQGLGYTHVAHVGNLAGVKALSTQ